jgi:hypothetical protein
MSALQAAKTSHSAAQNNKRPPASAGGLFPAPIFFRLSEFRSRTASIEFCSSIRASPQNRLRPSAALAGDRDQIARNGSRTGHRLWPQRPQPARRQPIARNGKLAPAAIQAYTHVGGGRHRRMAHGSNRVAVEPDFSRDYRYGLGLALGADHRYTSGTQTYRRKLVMKSA